MSNVRILTGIAAAALTAGSAFAQTGATSGYGAQSAQPASPTGAGAMQTPSTPTQPYAPPPTTGGAAQPSTGGYAQPSTGGYAQPSTEGYAQPSTGGSMSGTMQPPPGAAAPGAMGSTAGFTPVHPVPGGNIIATLQASGQFTRLLAALQATNLTGLLSTHPNLTLFAPTDAAFAQLPPGQLDQLMKSPQQLQAILTYHLVATVIHDADVKGHAAGKVQAADNKQLSIDGSGASIRVNDAAVLQSGVATANGVIFPIDKVLTPPTV